MANTNDWIDLIQRTKKAYTPSFGEKVLQPFGQAFGQGIAGKQIAQKELRKAIMTALLGTHTPMVGGVPATPEQIAAGMEGKPGLIPSLLGAKEPPKLTWEPIKETKYAEEYPWKAQLETFKSGLQAIIEEQKLKNQKELEKYKSELGAETPLTKEKVTKLEYENEQLRLMTESMTEAFEKMRGGKSITETFQNFFSDLMTSLKGKMGIKTPEAKTPAEGVQPELPGMEGVPPTPTEEIPDWLPEEVKVRLNALKEAGASEEEIQEIINYYRR